ncbi:G-box-binding factor 3 [Daphnia magna]|uniref:Uncharacterized protein n=2 Tax=Daphnia magna TaxID=35525 RepID=A0ABQ9ZPV5_9CRUS|nr:G-box-binding factor 3 [Daphnia magna]KAK4014828.1 hypothetical protein OUZ56_027338 [Daphnia magna]KZS07607.1 putative Basic-leucine zipper transcription regulator giant [Daphnia magna]
MSSRGEETQHDEERPRPVRFSIFGQIQQQQQRVSMSHHHVSIKAESGEYMDDRYNDEDDVHQHQLEDGEDQPLDFSAKKPEPKITAKVAVRPSNGHDHHQLHHSLHGHFPTPSWVMPATSHSSESGVSDLCSNSPQSDNEPPMPAKSPLGGSPLAQQPREIQLPQQPNRMPQVTSPLPAALNAIYGPLAALQNSRATVNGGIDPAITAATTQLLSNLAAVTNGGKGGKNPRPFKAYPRDPMSLPLGLYGLPMAGNHNAGEETVMTQASNDAYAEFRRQMLSQVNATKSKRKSINENGNSRPNSVNGDSDDNTIHGHNGNDSDVPEATHIRGTVSVTDMRLISNDDDSEHSANDSIHAPSGGIKSPAINNNVSDMSLMGTSPGGGMMSVSAMAATTSGHSSSNGSGGKKRGRNGEEVKDEAYWERRRKNNEAAKRSRDARRAKEDEIAIRAAFLEQENLKLRFELANLKNETAKLRCMIYNS